MVKTTGKFSLSALSFKNLMLYWAKHDSVTCGASVTEPNTSGVAAPPTGGGVISESGPMAPPPPPEPPIQANPPKPVEKEIAKEMKKIFLRMPLNIVTFIIGNSRGKSYFFL